MFFQYFSRQIYFSRTLQDSPVYSSTFQACANPVKLNKLIALPTNEDVKFSDAMMV